MKERSITVLTEASLITCIVQRGVADDVVKAAQDAGAQGATVHYAQGVGVRERLGILGLAVEVEKEVITIIVANDQADRVFEAMYLAGKLDTPGMGIMTLAPLEKVATFVPLEIVDEQVRDRPRQSRRPQIEVEAAGPGAVRDLEQQLVVAGPHLDLEDLIDSGLINPSEADIDPNTREDDHEQEATGENEGSTQAGP